MLCRDSHCLGSIFRLISTLPQDRRAAFRRDYRVNSVLQHQQAIANADRQRAAGAALADDDADDRRLESGHQVQAVGDGLTLTAFLGANTRIGTRRIDQSHDGSENFSAIRIRRCALR